MFVLPTFYGSTLKWITFGSKQNLHEIPSTTSDDCSLGGQLSTQKRNFSNQPSYP